MVDFMASPVDSLQATPKGNPIKGEMNLKAQLRLLLDLRGMTPTELARKSGVSKQVISLWQSGAKPKNVEQVKAVADALSVSVDCLLFGNGDERGNNVGLDALLGDEWISGAFEIKIRRIKGGRK
jgi:transcriptional regulator with XRE-family HTH domain